MFPLANIRSLLVVIAMALSAIPVVAQQPTNTVLSDSQTSEPQAPSQPALTSVSSRPALRTFRGTIRRDEDGYILRDSSGASYELDNQIRVRDFDGQNVKLRGILNASTHSIRVKSIEPSY